MDKYIRLIILFIFASLGFYNPMQLIPATTQKLIFYVITMYCCYYAFQEWQYVKIDKKFKYSFYAIIIGILISAIMATMFHDQNIETSITTILYRLFAYSFLLILICFNPSIEKIEKLLVIMGIVGIIVNGINMQTAPNCFFGSVQEELDDKRGFVRVRTPIIYICFLFFHALSKIKYNESKRLLWIGLSILSYAFIVFWVARQYIVLTAVLGTLYFLSNLSWTKKMLISISLLLILQYVVMELPFVQNMISMSQEQQSSADEDTRIVAWNFYTNDYQSNELTRFLGNGVPSMGNSEWGIEFESLIDILHVYPSDVGWAGFYFYHGVIALAGLVCLFLFSIFSIKNEGKTYINYVLILFVLTTVAGGAIIIPQEVVALMAFMYIAYKSKNRQLLFRR